MLTSAGKSISQSAQANKIDKNNPRPTYNIPDEYKQNVNMARQMAQIGLPTQQYNNQLNNINQNQSSAIGALNNSANPGANLASIVRGGNAATGNLNAEDAQAKIGNQRFFIGQNAQLGQQELAQQQYNKFDKYTEDYNKSAALRGAADQNLQNGLNGAAGLASNLYGMNQLGGTTQPTAYKPTAGLSNDTTRGFNTYLQGQQSQLPQANPAPNFGLGNVGDPFGRYKMKDYAHYGGVGMGY